MGILMHHLMGLFFNQLLLTLLYHHFQVDEDEVVKIMAQVNVAIREAEIRMDETDFEERQLIYKRKRLLLKNQELLGKSDNRSNTSKPDKKQRAEIAKKKKVSLNGKRVPK